MKLKVLGSGSSGNCYIFENENEALIIECGVHPDEVKKALDYNFSKVSGIIITHEHGDHAKYIGHLLAHGLDVFASNGTHNSFRGLGWHRRNIIEVGKPNQIGGFEVNSFDVEHDASEPFGFLISHNDFGKMVFCTDSKSIPYKFKDLDHILIEANYDFNLISKSAIRDRVFQNHMEIDTTIKFLENNDLSNVKNIVLLHLSDSNSNEKEFEQRVQEVAPNCNVLVAKTGLELELINEIF